MLIQTDLCNLYGTNPEKMSLALNMVPVHEDISKQKIAELFEELRCFEQTVKVLAQLSFAAQKGA
ncbi:Hypothetical protein DEACI_0745 [Acididesulfobacillus acetoxydans]|uniref:Uncharacterized protein n=1 Tax=Acididesulfobacillus acetoxydans TaxID=1561005 RepID=A0A8S0Y1Y2_9FIRM|nr:hypothetical protein [Acididesulfobacillus acetoxydans]CAA7600095.1 Hypothetical protein DEACI_0745 [Acididesulfobacillus acetoxydans]CEJ07661.1 Hypothetical protein DEACI_2127 [Acididesulfobacillus acetoxydans]